MTGADRLIEAVEQGLARFDLGLVDGVEERGICVILLQLDVYYAFRCNRRRWPGPMAS